ncbi:hypothetical protein [Holospora curviuscula]|uniref:hypothetical protein n=1 Tax=Holospora curviuscula TaxID=1082868 RepID=UPI003C6C70AC
MFYFAVHNRQQEAGHALAMYINTEGKIVFYDPNDGVKEGSDKRYVGFNNITLNRTI